jgi:hypothetical protein
MLKINSRNKVVDSSVFEYELENGVLLHEIEWNGEGFIVKDNGGEVEYRPVEKAIEFDEDNEPINWEVIGFEEWK